ncbi:MAG: YeeE/YedE family protein [Bacteroidales bacterium]|nr:YeeE/YedE family protein [Bacteroidales bacterium]
MLEKKKWKYMNPYFAGTLLGLVLLASFYFAGQGLGASGAGKKVVVTSVIAVAPGYAENSDFYKDFAASEHSPMYDWLVFQVLGVLLGGFLSGALAGRLTWKVERSPKISRRKRLIFAVIGGMLFGFGAQLAKGCTSGAALSGMATLALSGFVAMVGIFGTAFMLSFLFKKLWV